MSQPGPERLIDMSLFVLIPGAGGAAWYWHRLMPELEARGHEAVAVGLPAADESIGLPEYTDRVVAVIGGRDDVIVVAQSLGGFTGPMACTRAPVRQLVLLNAMIPLPGETPGEWWGNTGSGPARIAAAEAGGYPAQFDLETYFLHDVPAAVVAAGEEHQQNEADIVFGQPCDIKEWPKVTTRVLAGTQDRFFPVGFQRRVARDRLGIDIEETPGGHLAALSYPAELADQLTRTTG
jgi:pimeloyl-ACP methyl ester carboxylesterase